MISPRRDAASASVAPRPRFGRRADPGWSRRCGRQRPPALARIKPRGSARRHRWMTGARASSNGPWTPAARRNRGCSTFRWSVFLVLAKPARRRHAVGW